MKKYLSVKVWDWILCVAMSTGLVFHIFSGFVLTDSLYSSTFAVILIIAAVTAIMELLSYNRLTVWIGVAAAVVILAAYLVIIRSAGLFSEEEGHSLGITIIVIIAVSLVVYLATRTKVGAVIIIILGNVIIAGTYFLQYPIKVWQFITFIIAAMLMFVYRNYYKAIKNADTGKIHLPKFFSNALAITVIAFGLALAAFFGIIQPINPPTRDLVLITKLEQMDILQVFGIFTKHELLDPSLLSKQEIERLIYSGMYEENDNGDNQVEEESTEPEETEEETDQANGSEDNVVGTFAANVTHFLFDEFNFPWILAIIIIIIVGAFVLRMIHRKRWERKVDAISAQEQVVNYYQFFLNRFSHLGFKKPKTHTLSEYAANMEHEMEIFSSEQTSFGRVTDIYIKVFYGRDQVSEEDLGCVKAFYRDFFKNLRREIGTFKYLLHIFMI